MRTHRTMRRALLPLALTLPVIALAACAGADYGGDPLDLSRADGTDRGAGDADEEVTIGIFEITSGAVFDDITDGFLDGFTDGTGLDAERIALAEENAQGDPTLIQSIARTFAESDADMVAVVGTPAVIAQAEQITDRPVIALAMGDPVGAGVAASLDAPGGNVTGSIDYIDPALLVDELGKVHADITSIGTLYDPANQNMQVWVEDLRDATAARDMELVEASATTTSEVEAATRSLEGRVDIVLTGPDTMVIEAIGAVGQVTRRSGIPLYTVGADVEVEGVVASLGPDYREVGRLAGVAAATVHDGTPPGEVAFGRPGELQWTIDDDEVERLEIVVPDEILAAST